MNNYEAEEANECKQLARLSSAKTHESALELRFACVEQLVLGHVESICALRSTCNTLLGDVGMLKGMVARPITPLPAASSGNSLRDPHLRGRQGKPLEAVILEESETRFRNDLSPMCIAHIDKKVAAALDQLNMKFRELLDQCVAKQQRNSSSQLQSMIDGLRSEFAAMKPADPGQSSAIAPTTVGNLRMIGELRDELTLRLESLDTRLQAVINNGHAGTSPATPKAWTSPMKALQNASGAAHSSSLPDEPRIHAVPIMTVGVHAEIFPQIEDKFFNLEAQQEETRAELENSLDGLKQFVAKLEIEQQTTRQRLEKIQAEENATPTCEEEMDEALSPGKVNAHREATLSEVETMAKEEIFLAHSVWNATLFIFLPEVGLGATFFVMCSLLMLMFMLIVFVGIIVDNFVDPNSFGPATQASLNNWRMQFAHDFSHADVVTGTSLASRVCNQDIALVTSASQFDTVGNLQAYLPDLESCTTFSCKVTEIFFTGPMLCSLAIVVWFLTVTIQTRDIVRLGLALLLVPRHTHTQLVRHEELLQLETLSAPRKFFGMMICLLKLAFNMILLFTGTSFLVHSINLQNILLNTLALEFILHLEELFFDGLAPLQVVALLDNLKPLELISLRRYAGADVFTSLIPLFLVANSVVVYVCFLKPFIEDMNQAETILCGGDLDFIFAPDAAGVLWAVRSPPYGGSEMPLQQYETQSVKAAAASWSHAVATGAIKVSEPFGKLSRSQNFVWLVQANKEPHFFNLQKYGLSAEHATANAWNPYALYHLRQLTQNQSVTCGNILSLRSNWSCYQTYHWKHMYPHFGRSSEIIFRIQAMCQIGCGCQTPWWGTIFKSSGGCHEISHSTHYQRELAHFPCDDPSDHANSRLLSMIRGTLMHNPEISRLGLSWPAPSSPAFCAFAYHYFSHVETLFITLCPKTWGCKHSNITKMKYKHWCPTRCPCNTNRCFK